MMVRLARAALATMAFLAVGCASSTPSLPMRKIDRPYTLPEDTREFAVGLGFQYAKERGESIDRDIVPIAGGLSFPINANWTYDLFTHFRHQLHHDDINTYGFGFGLLDLGYTSVNGFFMTPSLSFYYRHNFSRDFALETGLRGNYRYFSENDARPFSLLLNVAPVWQIDDTKYLRLSAAIAQERLYNQLRDIFDDFRVVASRSRVRLVAPLSLDFGWRFDPQWEGRVNYDYNGIGYGNGYRAHTLGLAFSRYW